MHELSIATELFALAAQRVDVSEVLGTVHVAVGELSSTDPELLRFAWEAVVTGTPHERALLTIDWRAAQQQCDRCGVVDERQPGSWLRLCTHCKGPLVVVGGDELDLLAVTPVTSGMPVTLGTLVTHGVPR